MRDASYRGSAKQTKRAGRPSAGRILAGDDGSGKTDDEHRYMRGGPLKNDDKVWRKAALTMRFAEKELISGWEGCCCRGCCWLG